MADETDETNRAIDGYFAPKQRARRAFVAGVKWASNNPHIATHPRQVHEAARAGNYTATEPELAEFTWGAATYVRIMREWEARHVGEVDE